MGSRPVVHALREEQRPVQLGVSTSGGMRGDSACCPTLCQGLSPQMVLLKIDMRDAFNSLRRESFLPVACLRTPGLYCLLWQAYFSQTRSFFGEEGFDSETGIQQGAPTGPALFALSVDEADRGVQSEFNMWYFHNNLVVLLKRLRAIFLEVNGSKCELTSLNNNIPEATKDLFRALLLGIRVVEACDISLLGVPAPNQKFSWEHSRIKASRHAIPRQIFVGLTHSLSWDYVWHMSRLLREASHNAAHNI